MFIENIYDADFIELFADADFELLELDDDELDDAFEDYLDGLDGDY